MSCSYFGTLCCSCCVFLGAAHVGQMLRGNLRAELKCNTSAGVSGALSVPLCGCCFDGGRGGSGGRGGGLQLGSVWLLQWWATGAEVSFYSFNSRQRHFNDVFMWSPSHHFVPWRMRLWNETNSVITQSKNVTRTTSRVEKVEHHDVRQ